MDFQDPGYSGDLPATGAAASNDVENLLEMFDYSCYSYADDLYEFMRQGDSSEHPVSFFRLPTPPPEVKETPDLPVFVSDDELAAWLYPIVKGEGGGEEGHQVPPVRESNESTATPSKTEKKQKLPTTTEGKCSKDTTSDSIERRKTSGARRSHYAKAHRLTEKKRRCKINERFETLQQLVPGCNKSNQASTLDHTIQYVKSLQQQIQALSVGYGMKQRMLPMTAAPPPLMLPFGPPLSPLMLPCPHHPMVMMPTSSLYTYAPSAVLSTSSE